MRASVNVVRRASIPGGTGDELMGGMIGFIFFILRVRAFSCISEHL